MKLQHFKAVAHLHPMLELIRRLVVAGLQVLFAEQHRLLIQKHVTLLRFKPQPQILFALRPHLERVLEQQVALL